MMRWPDRAFHDTNILRVNIERSLEVQNLLMAACLPALTTAADAQPASGCRSQS